MIAMEMLMPSVNNVNWEFSTGIHVYVSVYMWSGPRIAGTVVKIKPKLTREIRDSKSAAHLADFRPTK